MTRCEWMGPVVAAVLSACCVVTLVASPDLPAPALPADEAGDPSSKEGAAAESTVLNPQVEAVGQRLIDEYRQQGEPFAEALMLAECSGEAMRGQIAEIADVDNWLGFDVGYWRRLEDEQVEAILMGVAGWMAALEPEDGVNPWREWREFMEVAAQVRLLVRALADNGGEASFQQLSQDPLLSPAFDFVRINRGPEFPDHLIGVTLASGEAYLAWLNMVRLLLEADPEERFACFSRLFALAAARQGERDDSTGETSTGNDPAGEDNP